MRVLIVGCGIVGLSTAYYAANKGHSVVVLDRSGTEAGGCSFGNAGMVVPSHFVPLAAPGMVRLGLRLMWNPESPFYVKPRLSMDLLSWAMRFVRAARAEAVARAAPLLRDLHLASRACFEEWAAAWGDFTLVTKGLLMLCKTDEGLREEARSAEAARELGLPAEVLTALEAAALEPDLTMDVAGAIYYPMDCHLDPGQLMGALRRRVADAGVRLLPGTKVTGWRAEGTRIAAVGTTCGELSADAFVVAAGVWSTRIVRDLGLTIPMQAGKGYSLTLTEPPRQPVHCAILSEARVAVTPMGTALRFGGTLELTGLDESVDPRRVRGLISSVERYYPAFGADAFRGVVPWVGLRPCSPDGLPYLGRFARYTNLLAATGHAMMGVSLGPITGRLVAEILSGETPSLDVSALSPDRYN
jgi:D-amino-acid dehydrogenase